MKTIVGHRDEPPRVVYDPPHPDRNYSDLGRHLETIRGDPLHPEPNHPDLGWHLETIRDDPLHPDPNHPDLGRHLETIRDDPLPTSTTLQIHLPCPGSIFTE